MTPGIPADNLSDSMTVGELIERLSRYAPDMKVGIRLCRMLTEESHMTADGEIHVEQLPNLDCALEAEDDTFVSDNGYVLLMTSHQVLDT